jgi:hypothetical protein
MLEFEFRSTTTTTTVSWSIPTDFTPSFNGKRIPLMSNEYEYDQPTIGEIENALWELVTTGKIEMGLDEEGEIVYWMTDEQRAAYFEECGE